jgi:hypothetical protein
MKQRRGSWRQQQRDRAAAVRQPHRARLAELKRMLLLYQHMARAPIVAKFGIPSCVPATRITIEVLAHFGFQARPLSVRTDIFNAAYMAALEKDGMEPCDVSQRWLNDHQDEHKAAGVGLVVLGSATAAEWNEGIGHVVAIAEEHWLVDASLSQANHTRDNIGVHVPDVALSTVTENFLTYRNALRIFPDMNECRVQYMAIKDDLFFTKSPAWNDPAISPVALDLVNDLKLLLDRVTLVEV